MKMYPKLSDIPQEVLLKTLLKQITKEVSESFPRMSNEPTMEYRAHLREEVEYAVDEKITLALDEKFGKRNAQWKDF